MMLGGAFSTVMVNEPVVDKLSPFTAVHVITVEPMRNKGYSRAAWRCCHWERYMSTNRPRTNRWHSSVRYDRAAAAAGIYGLRRWEVQDGGEMSTTA